MRLLKEWFPEFAEKFDEIDEIYREKRSIDEKTYQFICFALSIKNRSKPCLLKHFKGAMEAGATLKELAFIMALTFRERAPVATTAGRTMHSVTCRSFSPRTSSAVRSRCTDIWKMHTGREIGGRNREIGNRGESGNTYLIPLAFAQAIEDVAFAPEIGRDRGTHTIIRTDEVTTLSPTESMSYWSTPTLVAPWEVSCSWISPRH